ncbi:MAG: hypothetical protein Q9214_004988 [Letrouitia sp. 1 TL-2023]
MAMIARRPVVIHGKYLKLLQDNLAGIPMTRDSRTAMRTCLVLQVSHRSCSNGVSKTEPNSRPRRLEAAHDEDYFRFTRGRFISNEQHEMSQRYVRFDMHELTRLAAEAVGSKSCVSIEKYPDGMYNKAFLLTMDDGTQAVAKVPNPNAGRPHFTTSSEVATMEFVRKILGSPVPKVYAWSSRAQNNTVGAEYIIMEKLSGVQLEVVWSGMKMEDRLTVVKAIARHQKAWMSCSFSQIGSLYFAEDLDREPQSSLYTDSRGIEITNSRFAIGPSTGRGFSDDRRSAVEFDRGPSLGNTLEDYVSAVGKREIACLQSLARLPPSPVTLFGPGTYQSTRGKKLKALRCYLAIFKFLLPTDQSIRSSCLWHGDLHAENIFVDPETPTKVVGIIDWQSTELAPLFEHARQPYFLDYEGPPVMGLERPRLPDNLAQLEPAAQKGAKAPYLNQSLSALYKALLHKQNPCHYRAMAFQETCSFDLLLARNLLVDGEATYLAQVVELEKGWADLPGVCARGAPSFPLQFSHEERVEIEADVNGALRGIEAMREVQNNLGELFPDRGFVRNDQYQETRDALWQIRERLIKTYASDGGEREIWRKCWPFDD